MKNANMPAMPLPLGTETAEGCQGLTKREMMAMNAPEMPDWFDSQWRKEYEDNEVYFKEEVDEWDCSYLQITKCGTKAMYFAWRTHYADALLAELEKQQ